MAEIPDEYLQIMNETWFQQLFFDDVHQSSFDHHPLVQEDFSFQKTFGTHDDPYTVKPTKTAAEKSE